MTADTNDLRTRIAEITDEITPRLIETRRTLHANPELGFEEFETAALIKDRLNTMGVAFRDGLAQTGIAAMIGNGQGRLVGVRGDIDALPIQESADPAYKSRNDGKMHACGHDAHTTIALGVAEVMSRLAPDLPGRLMVIFQPAEEGLGGARAMLEAGLFETATPDVMLGYHNWPPLDGGTIGWHPQTAFASTDMFNVEIRGRSGHGAHPHLAVDPIVAAGGLVSTLQTVVSREVAPLDAAVVTIGKIQGGTARNQIPDTVQLEGSIRTQSPEVRAQVREAIERVCAGIGATYRVECALEFLGGVPPVVNDPEILSLVTDQAREMIGADHVFELPKGSMGSEDYAEFSTRIRSAHLRIGSRYEPRPTMLHRSDFDLDERCIPTAVKVLSAAALKLMDTEL